ncbi:MAG: hypothetical protein Q7J80_08535 [Anaerolineales bacterium]|nr:hypothetical protein [Anaerolineales bacterium]
MNDQSRRMYGFFLGIAFGLPYALISQYINVWMLPGIPLFELPIGRVASVILTALAMGMTGLIVGWSEESFWGLMGSSLFLVLASSMQAYINSGSSQAVTFFFLFLFTFLPRLIIYLPLAIAFRWMLGVLEGNARDSGLVRFLKVTVAILTLAILGGRFSMLVPEAREALQDMNALVLESMSAAENKDNLPSALIPVDGFQTYAIGSYTFEWSSDVDRLPVTRSIAGYGITESLILIRFESGYQFGCAFTPPSHVPKCINITRVR